MIPVTLDNILLTLLYKNLPLPNIQFINSFFSNHKIFETSCVSQYFIEFSNPDDIQYAEIASDTNIPVHKVR